MENKPITQHKNLRGKFFYWRITMAANNDKRKIYYVKNYYNYSNIFPYTQNSNNTQSLNRHSFLSHKKLSACRELIVILYKQVNPTFLYIVIISFRRSIHFLI